MKLSSIDFASPESYHEIQIKNLDLSEAEGVLAEERKKYLRTAAKEKTGQAPGVGALSTAAKGVYNIMVKQAVRAHLGVLSRLTQRGSRPRECFGAVTGREAAVEGEAQRRCRQRHKPPE